MPDPLFPVPQALTRHRAELDKALRAAVGDDQGGLAGAARYAMGWEDEAGAPARGGGKRIRPALCLLAGAAFGGRLEELLPGAVAVELVHNFSLVHDDIQDRDEQRHGRPTVWAVHGEGQAINVGDFLYMRAIQALTHGAGDESRRLRALSLLNDAIGRMIAGQWADLGFETRDEVSVEEYLVMSAGKTGALLGAPLAMGAILAGAAAEESALVGQWGQRVGLAFQACDDYLGIWGDPDATGKSNASDLRRRKKSLAIVYGMNHPASSAALRAAFEAPGEIEETAPLVGALEAAGADRFCMEQAARLTADAEALLARLELRPESLSDFREVAAFLVNRDA